MYSTVKDSTSTISIPRPWEAVDYRPVRMIEIVSNQSKNCPTLVTGDNIEPLAYINGTGLSVIDEANAVLISLAPALLGILHQLIGDTTEQYSDEEITKILNEISAGRITKRPSVISIRSVKNPKSHLEVQNKNSFGKYMSLTDVPAKEDFLNDTVIRNRLRYTWDAYSMDGWVDVNNDNSGNNNNLSFMIIATNPIRKPMAIIPIIAFIPIQEGAEANAILISRAPILHILVSKLFYDKQQGISQEESVLEFTRTVLDEIANGEV